MTLCVIHCGIHPPPGCQIHCGIHPPPGCQVHCGIHIPHDILNEAKFLACRANPEYQLGLAALRSAKNANIISRDNWQDLVNITVYTLADMNIIIALIALGCADCMTKEVFG